MIILLKSFVVVAPPATLLLLLLLLTNIASSSSSANIILSKKKQSLPTRWYKNTVSNNNNSGIFQKQHPLRTYSGVFQTRGGTGGGSSSAAYDGTILQPVPDDSDIDYARLVDDAYGWCCNLGAPSALVAGAVVASIYENMNNPNSDYRPENGDTRTTGIIKKIVRWLLITAFACEAICIFVTTVTGTMLLSQDVDTMIHQGIVRTAKTPLQFLHDHFEEEYLIGHIAFLQGLVHWFLAIGLSHSVPGPDETTVSPMNKFLATTLFTTVVFLLAVYNKHIYFYENYGAMLHRWISLIVGRFVVWPPRPLSIVLFPAMIYCIYLGIQVFFYHDNNHISSIEIQPAVPKTIKTSKNSKSQQYD